MFSANFLGPEAGQQAWGEGEPSYGTTATYSPDENKLRITSASRLDRAICDRVKEAGFRWAPKLEQFIVPMRSPSRADVCVELAGEIGDEAQAICLNNYPAPIQLAQCRVDHYYDESTRTFDPPSFGRSQEHRVVDDQWLGPC